MAGKLFRRVALGLAAPFVCVVVAVPALSAGSAHFIKNATSASLSGSSLVVSFKEAGLASGSVETIVVTASAAVTYECVNGGGRNPAASNKHTFQTTLSKSDTFTADKNGNVVGGETLSAPSAISLGFTCPAGQTVTFVSISYSNVSIDDLTSGATTTFAGTFSYSDPSAPPVR